MGGLTLRGDTYKDTNRRYMRRRDIHGKKLYSEKRYMRRWNIHSEGIDTYTHSWGSIHEIEFEGVQYTRRGVTHKDDQDREE